MAETMTPAERLRNFTLHDVHTDRPDDEWNAALKAGADALDRLAQTCGNCQHARNQRGGVVSCVPPVGPEVVDSVAHAQFPFWGLVVPTDERCKGWTKREDAP